LVLLVLGVVILAPAFGVMALDLTSRFSGRTEISKDELLSIPFLQFDFALREKEWHTSMRATFSEGRFSSLSFMDNRYFELFSVQSLLAFDPDTASFNYLRNLLRFSIQDIGFANQFYLSGDKERAYDQISLDGRLADVQWRAVARLGLCPVEFLSSIFQANWMWDDCGLYLSGLVAFSQADGFERFRLTAVYSEVPYLTWDTLTTDFVFTLEYTVDEKSIVPQLRTHSGQSSFCLTPVLAFETGESALSINGLSIYGIKFEYLQSNVELYAATSFADARNGELTGKVDYFEICRIRVKTPSCCAKDNRFELAAYFDRDSDLLFNWGAAMASIEFETGEGLGWKLATEFTSDSEWMLRVGWDWRL
jgi:hypothetical protein